MALSHENFGITQVIAETVGGRPLVFCAITPEGMLGRISAAGINTRFWTADRKNVAGRLYEAEWLNVAPEGLPGATAPHSVFIFNLSKAREANDPLTAALLRAIDACLVSQCEVYILSDTGFDVISNLYAFENVDGDGEYDLARLYEKVAEYTVEGTQSLVNEVRQLRNELAELKIKYDDLSVKLKTIDNKNEINKIHKILSKYNSYNQKIYDIDNEILKLQNITINMSNNIERIENYFTIRLNRFISNIKAKFGLGLDKYEPFKASNIVARLSQTPEPDQLLVLDTPGVSFSPIEKRNMRKKLSDIWESGGYKKLSAEIIRANKHKPPYDRAMLWCAGADIISSSGRADIAENVYNKAINIYDGPLQRFRYANFLYNRGHYVKASQLLDKFYKKGEFRGPVYVERLYQKVRRQTFWREPGYELEKLTQDRSARLKHPKPKRIAYCLHNAFPYATAGYASRSHGLASAIHRRGYDVCLVPRAGFPSDLDPERHADLPVRQTIRLDALEYHFDQTASRRALAHAFYNQAAADSFEQRFRRIKPSIVQAASNYVVGFAALIAARRLGLPFVYEARGFWELTRASREPEFADSTYYEDMKRLETFCALEADKVMTLTRAMKDFLIKRGVPRDKIQVIPNSVDAHLFQPQERDFEFGRSVGIDDDDIVIGYIGSHVVYEGLDLLIEACALLRDQGYKFKLLLVGDGAATEALHKQIDELELRDRIVAPGRVPYEEARRYYSLVDIAPFPRKPWPVCEIVSPMKPFEAMAMEKAVIVSNVRALAEIVTDERTGLVFDKGDIMSLADTLRRLIENPELRAELGVNARRWVRRNRTWDATSKKAVKVYEALNAD